MKEKSGCSMHGSGHMKWIVLLALVGLAIALVVPSFGWLPMLVFLLCPLMMIGMMLTMHNQPHPPENSNHSCCKSAAKLNDETSDRQVK